MNQLVNTVQPPYLQKGDRVHIVCPSGYLAKEQVKECTETLQRWGFHVTYGKTVGLGNHYFAGTDEERLQDLQNALNDPSIAAILCGRGGYGMSRIIDSLQFTQFKKHPKWIIGYSDITLLHNHIFTHTKVASIHSPMAAAFKDKLAAPYLEHLRQLLCGEPASISVATHSFNKWGKVAGPLVGGNLAMLAHAIGTKSAINTQGTIVFFEDVDEHLYQIDRMLLQLLRSNFFAEVKGIIVGKFVGAKDTTRPFGKSLFEILDEHLGVLGVPVAYDFPISHSVHNYPVKLGTEHVFEVSKTTVTLTPV